MNTFRPQSAEDLESCDCSALLRMSPKELSGTFDEMVSNGEFEEYLISAGDESASRIIIPILSYYEKWFKEPSRKALDDASKRIKAFDLVDRFCPDELALIIERLFAIQLTTGCSGACPRCMFDAVPEVRDVPDLSGLRRFILMYRDTFTKAKPVLYHASDVRDHPEYPDLHVFMRNTCGYEPHVTTKVSDDKESLEWLKSLSEVARDVRLSLFHILDVDKIKRLLGKVRKATEGVFDPAHITIPCRVAEDHDSRLEVLRHLDSALESLAMDLSMFGVKPKKNSAYTGHASGVGVTFETPEPVVADAVNGVFLAPRGLYNALRLTQTSEQFPQGNITVPILDIAYMTPRVGDFLPELLTRCVVLKGNFSFPNPYLSQLNDVDPFDEELTAAGRRYANLATTLPFRNSSGGFSNFRISYGNDGVVIAVKKLRS